MDATSRPQPTTSGWLVVLGLTALWDSIDGRPKAALLFWFYGWLVGCFGFSGPLRQYFSLYRAGGGGRVVRWCWVNFQCRGVLQFGLQ